MPSFGEFNFEQEVRNGSVMIFLIPEQGVNAIVGNQHLVAAKGQYETSDPVQQRFLRGYPGVVLHSFGPTKQKGNGDKPFGPQDGQPVVTNSYGLQARERRPSTSSRVAKVD